MPEEPSSSRREFLSGQALRTQAAQAGEILADALAEPPPPPTAPVAGDTVRLQTTAMACDFAVIMNPDRGEQIPGASDALQRVHELESQMTVYRDGGELAEINRRAFAGPVPVEARLFELLTRAKRLAEQTGGAFDPTSGPLIALWRHCRAEGRVPSADELDTVRRRTGIEQVAFDEAATSVRFLRDGVELNLGGIGKGYALDRIAAELESAGFTDFLIHGGHSSLLARGRHSGCDGWPVGIRNPLFPQQQFATVLMRGGGLSTSGSGVQSFRHAGKRYGHILDPRTGVPAKGMLSVSVIAPTAADADALSTAFFVMGLEKTRDYCDNRPEIGAILIPTPWRGQRLGPVFFNVDEGTVFLEDPEF